MGGKTDWVGKKLTSQIFPRGKKLTGQFFPRERMGWPILSSGKKLTGGKTDRYTGTLTCQHFVDQVLHPHVLQIYQTVICNFLFQQDNANIPAIWQGTVCKLVMSYPLNWPSGSRSISDQPPLRYSGLVDT